MNLSEEIISKAVQSVMDGYTSPCEVYAMLKNLSNQISSAIEVIKEPAMEEARDFNKDEQYYGGSWYFRSSQTYLNFSEDSLYNDLSDKLSERKKDLNQAWKSHQSGKLYVDADGEQIPVLSVKTPAKEGLIFKAK